MIELLLLATMTDVQLAMSRIDDFCRVLKCPKPILISIVPDNKFPGVGAQTRRIGNNEGCSIIIRWEALYRIDWLAHEACHCANDYKAMTEYGWDPSLPKEERNRRENAAISCSQKLLEKNRKDSIH